MHHDEAKLRELCREWQGILGLAHWDIAVEVVRGVEIGDARGRADISVADEQALIRIKDPADHHGYFPYDMEQTLVHELLHVVLDAAGEAGGVCYERAIDRLARAMVRMGRAAKA